MENEGIKGLCTPVWWAFGEENFCVSVAFIVFSGFVVCFVDPVVSVVVFSVFYDVLVFGYEGFFLR
jgi:hypothetical protein